MVFPRAHTAARTDSSLFRAKNSSSKSNAAREVLKSSCAMTSMKSANVCTGCVCTAAKYPWNDVSVVERRGSGLEPKSSPVSISLRLRRRKWEETSPRREENRENSAPLCVCCWSWSPSTRSRDDPLSSARSTVNVTSEDPLAKA